MAQKQPNPAPTSGRPKPPPAPPAKTYVLQEPTTGLYILPRADRPALTSDPRRAGFRTSRAALLAANAHIADQPHELVRIDA